MKNLYFALLSVALFFNSSCLPSKSLREAVKKQQTVTLESVMKQIGEQYKYAMERLPSTVHITEADAIFDITNSNIVDANASVLIFKADAKLSTQKETTVIYTFAENETPTAIKASVKETPDSHFAIGEMIVKTAKDLMNAPTIGKLNKRSFEIDISYVITLSGIIELTGTAGKTGLDASYERDHQVTHSIKLLFSVS